MIEVEKYTALELDTAQGVEGHYYLENGYWMINKKPDINRPVKRHYIVDINGIHREIAEATLELLVEKVSSFTLKRNRQNIFNTSYIPTD